MQKEKNKISVNKWNTVSLTDLYNSNKDSFNFSSLVS
jgi:hypothetical protein